jgi:hypothetical protein
LLVPKQSIEVGIKSGNTQEVRVGCEQFLELLSRFIRCHPEVIRVLASRPLRIRENWSSELFDEYGPSAMAIRVWMRTAVKKDITSFGSFFSTLCHEYCHHIGFQHFRFLFLPYTGLLPTRSRALPSRSRHTAQAVVLAATSGQRFPPSAPSNSILPAAETESMARRLAEKVWSASRAETRMAWTILHGP